ncbi:hypothetical protein [Martelella soudanensis]|uniref:hypothetical protein n=1 Tax=unclassified Martelella TaxID=2629616 RepID=UPI0015DF866C|nr:MULTISPECIES: hypothetical protein [unclassified Martelella]
MSASTTLTECVCRCETDSKVRTVKVGAKVHRGVECRESEESYCCEPTSAYVGFGVFSAETIPLAWPNSECNNVSIVYAPAHHIWPDSTPMTTMKLGVINVSHRKLIAADIL